MPLNPDLHFYVRDNASLQIIAEIPMPVQTELYPRFNDVGRFRIVVPLHGRGADFLTKTRGIVVVRNGAVVMSGCIHYRRTVIAWMNNDWVRSVEVSGPDDNYYLAARLAAPVPAGPPYSSAAYDARTGQASTIMREYIDVNLGPSAKPERRKAGLVLAADPAIGSAVQGRARFQPLIELLRGLALSGGDLGFRLTQSLTDDEITAVIYQPVDRTAQAAFSILAGTLRQIEVTQEGGDGNYVIVAGSGEGTARTFHELGDSDSILDYERIEFFRDRRDTSDIAELQQTALEELERNAERINLNITPVDAGNLTYPDKYNLGDRVSVDIVKEPQPNVFEVDFTYEDIVREIQFYVDPTVAEVIKPVVGTPDSRAIAFRQQQRQKELEQRVSGLERR